ncbi:DUF2809 domain-containing protein [Calothrix sp. PCC 6303]|uniref:ribosomal maturation YjgA family protein n=1 Tax=Calothrix sp. PCC 6303 TaxID=1170562 RepID=UPI0002A04D59|nr:DUF2809 domain-containing protein [Calothrix sp. PCC 6303]AFZ03974.1 hypothetical protein Cal6303_5085 [Calothrix sp. PCC 6303]
MFTFKKKYFYLTVLLFIVEVFIAVFIDDNFIRPFIGDVLVVILLYCFVRAFSNARPLTVALSVLGFSYIIEVLQYFNFVKVLGLQNNKILSVALGSVFDWKDIIAYTIGVVLVIWLENKKYRS